MSGEAPVEEMVLCVVRSLKYVTCTSSCCIEIETNKMHTNLHIHSPLIDIYKNKIAFMKHDKY
jgi:hypothetical protein